MAMETFPFHGATNNSFKRTMCRWIIDPAHLFCFQLASFRAEV